MTSDHYRFEQVSPNAWAAVAIPSGAAVGNAGFANGLVVDCGFMPAGARDLRAAAGRVDRLFITHADFDHYGGAQAFADVPILASEQTAATIREVGPGRITGMKEQIDAHLAELEEKDAAGVGEGTGKAHRRRGARARPHPTDGDVLGRAGARRGAS